MQPATTLAGINRQQMKWTDEVNQQLLRCYTVTNCETSLTNYRPALYTKFIEIYPDLHILSEQRLADQIWAIYRNTKISPSDRVRVKVQVEENLLSQTTTSTDAPINQLNSIHSTYRGSSETNTNNKYIWLNRRHQTHQIDRLTNNKNSTYISVLTVTYITRTITNYINRATRYFRPITANTIIL